MKLTKWRTTDQSYCQPIQPRCCSSSRIKNKSRFLRCRRNV